MCGAANRVPRHLAVGLTPQFPEPLGRDEPCARAVRVRVPEGLERVRRVDGEVECLFRPLVVDADEHRTGVLAPEERHPVSVAGSLIQLAHAARLPPRRGAGNTAGRCSAVRESGLVTSPERVREVLLAWYGRNGRDLPWRRTRDPYAILVSEVMLQQYRVENVELPAMQLFSA